jgi:hypothetical protein
MLHYKAPLRDMRFLINEVLDYPQHYSTLSNGAEATPEMVDAILEGAATLCEEVLAPLNASGDKEGCHLADGVVTTPKGFKEAYAQFIAGGWQGLSFPVEYGGQGLPMSLNLMKSEMMGAANWSFNMYPGLSIGCINTLLQYGTDAIKTVYLPRPGGRCAVVGRLTPARPSAMRASVNWRSAAQELAVTRGVESLIASSLQFRRSSAFRKATGSAALSRNCSSALKMCIFCSQASNSGAGLWPSTRRTYSASWNEVVW